MRPDLAPRDTGLVPVDSLLPSDAGLAERGVELARLGVVGHVGEAGQKVGGITDRCGRRRIRSRLLRGG